MVVADIMTLHPLTTTPGATVAAALRLMMQHEYHQLPVLSNEGHVVGIINQRDCRRVLGMADPAAPIPDSRLRVGHHMQPAPINVEPNTPVQEAARLITAHHIRALPVMRGETLVGIITVSDLLIAFMQVLRSYESDHTLDDGARERRPL